MDALGIRLVRLPIPIDSGSMEMNRTRGEDEQSIPIPRWLRVGGAWGWRLVVLAAVLYGVLWIGHKIRLAVLPIVLAIPLSALLVPIASVLRKIRAPRVVAGALSVLLTLGFFAGVGTFLGLTVAGEVGQVTASVEQGYRELVRLTAKLASVPPDEVSGWVDAHLKNVQSSAGSVARAALTQVKGLAQGLAVLALTLVFTWLFIWDGDKQFERAVSQLPYEQQRNAAREIGMRMWRAVGSYMRGMFVIAAADAILLGAGLWIVGLPLVVPLMLIMFLGALIPFVGPLVAGGTAALVGLAHGGISMAGLAVGVTFIVQQIEGNLLHPFVMGRAVHLHPALVLFAVTVGAVLGGVVGIFLAIPIATSLMSALTFARDRAQGNHHTSELQDGSLQETARSSH